MEEQKKIYLVVDSFNEEYSSGTKVSAFSTYEKAKNYYDKLIAENMENGMSSRPFAEKNVMSDRFEDDPNVEYRVAIDDYPDEERHSWEFYRDGEYLIHSSKYSVEPYIIDRDDAEYQEQYEGDNYDPEMQDDPEVIMDGPDIVQ